MAVSHSYRSGRVDDCGEKSTALVSKRKDACMLMRVETMGERAANKALVELQKKERAKRTYRLECAEGLRGEGTLQQIRGLKLRPETVCACCQVQQRTESRYQSTWKTGSRVRVAG
jgi:hypothetical protein